MLVLVRLLILFIACVVSYTEWFCPENVLGDYIEINLEFMDL